MNDEAKPKVKSLAKALDMLNCFNKNPELGVTEIAELMSLQKSNVHNILSTFKLYGYLEQDPTTEKYRLGIKLLDFNRTIGERFSIRQVALPFMQEISNHTRERVYLAVPRADEVLYLEAVYPASDFSLSRSLMGVRARMHCTALGKAMLAYLPAQEVEAYLKNPLESYTENTITDAEVFRQELAGIREKAFAIDNMEHEFGIKCIAKPILDSKGHVVAALSISAPSPRIDTQKEIEYAHLLKENISIIETRI